MSEEKGERAKGERRTEEMNGFWKRSAGRGRGSQSCEEREESEECDLTAEDCGILFGLPRGGMMHQNQWA